MAVVGAEDDDGLQFTVQHRASHIICGKKGQACSANYWIVQLSQQELGTKV
jgi:hypothetical protein